VYYEAVVAKLVRPESQWLDVGCGRGVFPSNPRLAQTLAKRCSTRLLDEGYSYREVLVVARDRSKGKAEEMTLKNFLSVGHTLFDMPVRRASNRLHGRKPTPAPVAADRR
jgi:hypothetical protein